MNNILILGGVSYNTLIYLDRFPEPVGQTVFSKHCYETVGSTGAGKALNLRRLGYTPILYAGVGQDEWGHKVIDYFDREGILFRYAADPLGTQRHVNLMNASGERISIFIAYGSSELPGLGETIPADLASCDHVVLNISPYCRGWIPALKKSGKPIWVDIHDYDGRDPYHDDFLAAADYLFLSSDALPDYRAFMQGQIRAGKRLVVCTHGKEGSTALNNQGEWLHTPISTRFSLVDSNGAGDAFFAGFLYATGQGYPLKRCLQAATLTAGLCIESYELAHPGLSPAWLERELAGLQAAP